MSTASPVPRLSLADVGVHFRSHSAGTETTALEGIDLSVANGEFLCILGPSGSGKSTLLNAVAGLLSDRPAVRLSGEMRLDGAPLASVDPRMGYVFQADTLLPWRTVLENVSLPLRIRAGRNRKAGIAGGAAAADAVRARALALLDRVGLSGFESHYPRQLSGGMRKRVQLAQLLAQDSEVFLMDEPFGSLDAQTRLVMQMEFLGLWEQERKTVVFVTHDLNEAILLADRIVCLSARPGRVVASIPVDIPRPRSVERLAGEPAYPKLFARLWRCIQGNPEGDDARGSR